MYSNSRGYIYFLLSLLTNKQSELLDNLIKTVTILLNINKDMHKREKMLTQVEPWLFISISASFKKSLGGFEKNNSFYHGQFSLEVQGSNFWIEEL